MLKDDNLLKQQKKPSQARLMMREKKYETNKEEHPSEQFPKSSVTTGKTTMIQFVGLDPESGEILVDDDLTDDSGNHGNNAGGSVTSSGCRTHLSESDNQETYGHSLHGAIYGNLRRFVIWLFFAIAICLPVVVYITTRNAEEDSFQQEFESISDQVLSQLEISLGAKLAGIDSMGVAATSYALDTNATWPFVTLPDYDLIAKSTVALIQTPVILFQPFVTADLRSAWETYASDNIGWLWTGLSRGPRLGTKLPELADRTRSLQQKPATITADYVDPTPDLSQGFSREIFILDETAPLGVAIDNSTGPYLPAWQFLPLNPLWVNFNLLGDASALEPIAKVLSTGNAVMSQVENMTIYSEFRRNATVDRYSFYLREFLQDPNASYTGEPLTNLYYPVMDSFEGKASKVVGVYSMAIFWELYFVTIVPAGSKNGMVIVIENKCGDVFSYEVNGEQAKPKFLGYEDHHSGDFDSFGIESYDFALVLQSDQSIFSSTTADLDTDLCPYWVRVYPSKQMEDSYTTFAPIGIALSVAVFFLIVTLVAVWYDYIMRRRIRIIVRSEKEAYAVVGAHFPNLVHERLFLQKKDIHKRGDKKKGRIGTISAGLIHPKARIKNYLNDVPTNQNLKQDDMGFLVEAPVADLFLHCTVLFADISGFSAWSSEREPAQVFTLLETIFQNFDRIARKRGVFKVETVADSYVAVTGLPEPQTDHAVRMTRFAKDSLSKANEVTRALETTLGPDTGDLRFRFGLNSGQITAGVLRGEKARFQLFGDTVNFASRMESTGQGNRIQLSEATAKLLFKAGKEDWIQLRTDPVSVKGKGVVKTYWAVHYVSDDVSLYSRSNPSSDSESNDDAIADDEDRKGTGFTDEKDMWGENEKGVFMLPPSSKVSKNHRLVNWLTDIMTHKLKRLVAQRETKAALLQRRMSTLNTINPTLRTDGYLAGTIEKRDMVLEEVVEAFVMPKLDLKRIKNSVDPESIVLDPLVESQLRDYLEAISGQYRDNPFHNFEHASHVTMSAVKLLNRIVAPEDIDYAGNFDAIFADLHDCTYGITSDALAQFAVVFSTLIHDVDHRGVPNGQLASELPELEERYKGRSVAEQNSVDLAWDSLMEPQYKELQQCIFTNEKEIQRFRHYIVNLVMATDIFEKEMKLARDQRWEKAFTDTKIDDVTDVTDSVTAGITAITKSGMEAANLKATIVLEHIIQAADVSHTMQHFVVYKKWNEKLFRELYDAFECGRAEKNPADGWYGGELWFFDNYVIPLAKKLEQCGVFGVSSDECLTYALTNRREWEENGREIVQEMTERYHKRKKLEVGGFALEEINSFTHKELEYMLQQLIKKGRAFGSFKGTDRHGQRNAAQAWLDALEIHERCPASPSLKDHTMIFPVFSGLVVFIKGGKILQDGDCDFEQNLVAKFVRDSRRLGDPVHYTRALAMLCEVQARAGKLREALETFDEIKEIYDAKKHTAAIAKSYGTDRSAHAFSQSALWHQQLGDTESALEACDYVVNVLLPQMDPANILNSCELLLPVVRTLAYKGQVKEMRDLFDEHVVQNYYKHDIKFTPCRPILKPLIMLLDVWHDPENYPDFDEAVDWLLLENSSSIDDFFDSIVSKLGWAPNTMTADLCLRFARKLHGDGGDIEKVKHLVNKGIGAAKKAGWKMKDKDGEVKLPVAYEIHEPVIQGLEEFAGELDISLDTENETRVSLTPDTPLQTSLGLVMLCA